MPGSSSQPVDSAAKSPDWHLTFSIPDMGTFSKSVRMAISTGVITDKARKQIVQVLRTYITKYTLYPSPEQYTAVCQQLITKFPKLKDQEGLSIFVST